MMRLSEHLPELELRPYRYVIAYRYAIGLSEHLPELELRQEIVAKEKIMAGLSEHLPELELRH